MSAEPPPAAGEAPVGRGGIPQRGEPQRGEPQRGIPQGGEPQGGEPQGGGPQGGQFRQVLARIPAETDHAIGSGGGAERRTGDVTREAGAAAGRALVTGAGTGIGRAVARALLDAGFGVTLAGRRRQPLEEAAAGHPDALVVTADVTDAIRVEELFAAHAARFGRLDVLFNNAGTFGPAADVGDLDPADWDATAAVNITGAVLCAGAAFRMMRAQTPQGGRIIDNGSISAQTPRPRSVAYTTTKHAIAGLTKSIELDGRAHRITATQLDIGNARTGLVDALVGDGALQADGSRRIEPTMDVAHVAELVVRLARLPLEVSVPQLTVTAAGMPFIGRG